MDTLAALARVFGYLSFLTIGGGMAAYPEMKIQVVQVHRWLTNAQLVHIYSTGQMSPGPNMMMVAQIGQIVSGFPGALVCALAFFVPTGILTFGIGRLWKKLEHWPWRVSIQKGLAPVAIGLAIGGLITFGRTSLTGWLTLLIGFATFAAVARTKINPVFFILGAGVLGIFALR